MGRLFEKIGYKFLEFIADASPVLIIAVSFAVIVFILYLAIMKIQHRVAGILVSTFLCCIFTVPIVTAVNNIVARQAGKSIIDENNAEIRMLRAQAATARAENQVRMLEKEKLEHQVALAKQSIEIETLYDNIKLLENAQLSMQSFEKILELALLQTNFKQSLVRKERISDVNEGWGFKADLYYDEILVIIAHDIVAKFGVDLAKIKIAKIDGNTVVVSGIAPMFVGAPINVTDYILSEIRRIDLKEIAKSGEYNTRKVEVFKTPEAINRATAKAQEYAADFQRNLKQEFGFMDDAIIQLAQNFIKVILAPVYRSIRFDDVDRPDALPLMDYLKKELNDNKGRQSELIDTNEDLLSMILHLEKETAELEAEFALSDTGL